MGLVKQCVTSLYKKNIQRLTKVSMYVAHVWQFNNNTVHKLLVLDSI